uniref:hypothetical protein n=1 Tax=Prevotella sp. TaxID=59823 RepID=UPI004025B675
MKKLLFIMALICAMRIHAQKCFDDIGRISIHAYVPESEEIPYESHKMLVSKLSQIISANGIADNENVVRFILTAKINVVSKDIVVGPPQRISQKLDITFILGDIDEDKVYSQLTISAIGIGQNLEKSYISAFKNINSKNPAIMAFIQEGKERLLAYYQTHCNELIAEAKKQASQQNYEEALMLLTSIPSVCASCFEESARIATTIYTNMIEVRGAEFLNQARATWANNPSREGAIEATRLLSQINFAASCQTQATSLLKEITVKMNEIDRREWKHQMQVYHDGIEREKRQWTQNVREYEDNVQAQRMYLKATRDVAIAYAKNQPKKITRVINFNRVILW